MHAGAGVAAPDGRARGGAIGLCHGGMLHEPAVGELARGVQLGCGDPRFASLEPTSEQSEWRDDDFLPYDAALASCAASDEEAGRCQWVAPASPPELTEGLFSFMDNVRFFTQRVWPSFHACTLLWNVGPAADPVHVLQAPPPEPEPTKQRDPQLP
jgi:hypothetical protein